MRLRFLALASMSLLAACASNEYSSVPEPTGEWVAVNPPGFQPLPLAPPTRPAVRRIIHRRPTPPPVQKAQTVEAKP